MSMLFWTKGLGFGLRKKLLFLENVILELKNPKGERFYWCNYTVFLGKRRLFDIPIHFLRKGVDL